MGRNGREHKECSFNVIFLLVRPNHRMVIPHVVYRQARND